MSAREKCRAGEKKVTPEKKGCAREKKSRQRKKSRAKEKKSGQVKKKSRQVKKVSRRTMALNCALLQHTTSSMLKKIHDAFPIQIITGAFPLNVL